MIDGIVWWCRVFPMAECSVRSVCQVPSLVGPKQNEKLSLQFIEGNITPADSPIQEQNLAKVIIWFFKLIDHFSHNYKILCFENQLNRKAADFDMQYNMITFYLYLIYHFWSFCFSDSVGIWLVNVQIH